MHARLVAGILALVSLSAAFGAGAFSGRRAPGFSLPDRTGKQYDPQDFRGKVVLVEMMQTSCPNCRALTGVLEQMAAKYGAKIQVLSIVVPPDTMNQVTAYIKDNKVSSPILFDSGQVTASYLRITPQNPTVKFPHLFLIDSEGVIRNDFGHEEAGKGGITAKLLSAEIDRLLKSPEPKKR